MVPVQGTANLIRDPYASRLPNSLRHHNEYQRQQQVKEKQLQVHQQQQQQQQQSSKQSGTNVIKLFCTKPHTAVMDYEKIFTDGLKHTKMTTLHQIYLIF